MNGCPPKVWIGTLEFSIAFVPTGDAALIEEGADLNGCTEFDPPSISVCKQLSATKALETLWHELTHAVNHVADIEDGEEEETIAEKHGQIWSQFWINNPRFQRWWMKACVAVRKERG